MPARGPQSFRPEPFTWPAIAVLAVLLLLGATGPAVAKPEVRYDHGPLTANGAQTQFAPVCAWGNTGLSYWFDNGTADIAGDAEEQSVRDAMALWSQVSPVTFFELSWNPQIRIRWGAGSHGDAYPFDGPGNGVENVLAHTFFPCAGGGIAGDMHFDEYETWTTSARPDDSSPVDLMTVAAHELGHSIGLDESDDPGALMYPYYSGSHRYLGWDDIAGVQSLYGRRNGVFHLRNATTSGPPASSFLFQNLGDRPVAGDWNGDGTETIGIWRNSNGHYILRDGNPLGRNYDFQYGRAGDRPLVGDWDGNGTTTVGVFRPSDGYFYLDNTNTTSSSEYWFQFGARDDLPVAGDWDGDGRDTIGMYRPSTATFYLRNTNFPGPVDITASFGASSDRPVVGDWNGDGRDTIGVYRPSNSTFYLRNTNAAGAPDYTFSYGANARGQIVASPLPVAGDWDTNGTTTIGLYQN